MTINGVSKCYAMTGWRIGYAGGEDDDKTRVLFLNSPSNPTGSCYSREELAALGEVLEQHPQIVVTAQLFPRANPGLLRRQAHIV